MTKNVCEKNDIVKSQPNGFVENKIINSNVYPDPPQHNWTNKLRPGNNVNAPHYIPKSGYKVPEHNQYSLKVPKITNNSTQIVPIHHKNFIYPNNLLESHREQQPLFYNYNNLATNESQFNDNKLQKINFTPMMVENNKKMLNNPSSELVPVLSQRTLSSLHQKDYDIDENPSLFKTPVNHGMSNNFPVQSNVASNQFELMPEQPSNQFELTPEQLRELNEEPLNTENAMVAVMGYNPQDDKRICKFYNANTNECFKGAHCKYEHVQKNKGNY